MCIAIPSKVLCVDGPIATVERYGERLEVSLAALPETPVPGDYLIIMGGRHAVERLDSASAEETLRLLEAVFGGNEDDQGPRPSGSDAA